MCCPVSCLSVLLNSPQIFDRIFADEFVMDVIGALECRFFTSIIFAVMSHFLCKRLNRSTLGLCSQNCLLVYGTSKI